MEKEKRDWGLEITNLTQGSYQLILAALLSKLFSARVIRAIEVLSGPGDERALMWTLLQVTLILGIPLIYFELKKTGSLGRAFFEHFSNILPISAALTFPISSGSLSFVYLGLGIYNLVQYFDGWKRLWRMIFKRSDRQHQRPSGQPWQAKEGSVEKPGPQTKEESEIKKRQDAVKGEQASAELTFAQNIQARAIVSEGRYTLEREVDRQSKRVIYTGPVDQVSRLVGELKKNGIEVEIKK